MRLSFFNGSYVHIQQIRLDRFKLKSKKAFLLYFGVFRLIYPLIQSSILENEQRFFNDLTLSGRGGSKALPKVHELQSYKVTRLQKIPGPNRKFSYRICHPKL